jgi:UDP-N-acetylglucosamine 2-epimerase
VLESRRRGIPSVGLQHGFIYRHWLNYLHASDEIVPDADAPADRGFPYPALTTVFDGYAAAHLASAGHYPETALEITGSPRLDALAAEASALTPDEVARARTAAGAATSHLVLVTTKEREAARVLPALLAAAAALPEVHVAIKTHPAETTGAYASAVAGRANVTVLDASAPLAPLLRACRAVVTVNSTVALDAAVLGVPALAIGLPNNLSPFVDAGVLAGTAGGASEMRGTLERILYDEEFRAALARSREAFLRRYSIAADGRAAERTAGAIVRLIASRPVAARDGRPRKPAAPGE